MIAFVISSRRAYRLAGRLLPGLAVVALALCAVGLGLGLAAPDADLPFGDLSRVALLHVPAAWLSFLLFVTLAFWAVVGLVLDSRLAYMMAHALAPTGGMFSFLALWTGAMWSKGLGQGWWTGDPRQVAELALLLLYLAIVGLPALLADSGRADRGAAVLAVLGVANVPILFFSVQWWWELQMGRALPGGPVVGSPLLLAGVVFVTVGFWLYATFSALLRLRHIILEREFVLRRTE